MKETRQPQSHEEHKIQRLLVRLSKMKPISIKPAPVNQAMPIAKGDAECYREPRNCKVP